MQRVLRSRVKPLVMLPSESPHYGIIAHARWHLHTSFAEGMNNKSKSSKCMAYGLRDDE